MPVLQCQIWFRNTACLHLQTISASTSFGCPILVEHNMIHQDPRDCIVTLVPWFYFITWVHRGILGTPTAGMKCISGAPLLPKSAASSLVGSAPVLYCHASASSLGAQPTQLSAAARPPTIDITAAHRSTRGGKRGGVRSACLLARFACMHASPPLGRLGG